MSADCLFCKIAAKKIPSKIVYEDDEVFAFEDIGPQAPTHILICPRKHFASLDQAGPEDQALLGKLQLVAAQLARKPRGHHRAVHEEGFQCERETDGKEHRSAGARCRRPRHWRTSSRSLSGYASHAFIILPASSLFSGARWFSPDTSSPGYCPGRQG